MVEIKKQFLARYDPESTDFASLPPYGTADFNVQLKKLMVGYGTTEGGKQDAITNTQQEIDSVKNIMTENIERVLERGERIDLLVDKTDRLGVGARDFRVRSRGLKRRMWWKNVKLMVLLGVVVVFLLYLFVGIGCGLPGKRALRLVDSSREAFADMQMVRMVEMRGFQMKRCDLPYTVTRQWLFDRSISSGRFSWDHGLN